MTQIVWLQLSSGRGPVECQWVVHQVFQSILADAKSSRVKCQLLELVEGGETGTCKSVLLAIEGEGAQQFSSQWQGTIQWVGQSQFRPKHKRKNWFVGISSCAKVEFSRIREQDIKFEAIKASGPGGQHVNKSHTAIRATHLPSEQSVVAQEERSQFMNRKLAFARLSQLLEKQSETSRQGAEQARWEHHNELERGNPVKVFKGPVGN